VEDDTLGAPGPEDSFEEAQEGHAYGSRGEMPGGDRWASTHCCRSFPWSNGGRRLRGKPCVLSLKTQHSLSCSDRSLPAVGRSTVIVGTDLLCVGGCVSLCQQEPDGTPEGQQPCATLTQQGGAARQRQQEQGRARQQLAPRPEGWL
jgi:hypothetical protein